jgi:Cu/Ag efflux pump CusA
MMNWIVSTSLNLRIVVVALGIVLMIAGIQIVRTTPLDVFPEFAPPLVEIQTEAPGLSTAEVESLISAPIENSLNGITSLKTLRSKSVLGLSSVVLIFQEGTDLMRARQLAQERLAIVAGALPAIAHPPVILFPLSSTSRVMKIGMSSATLSQMDLTTLARWTIRPRLMSIPGVANVAIGGSAIVRYRYWLILTTCGRTTLPWTTSCAPLETQYLRRRVDSSIRRINVLR